MNAAGPIRVSVIIPVYNRAKTIAEAVDSALAQDFDGKEVIVVDDGSTDGTPAVLAGYRERIRVVKQLNGGVASARNAGVRASRGEYLAFLDSDDAWLSGRIARTFRALEDHPSAVLAFSDLIARDSKGNQTITCTGPAPSLQDLLASISRIQPGTWLMRRSAFEHCGGFVEKFRGCGGEDLYMLLLAREQGEFVYVNEPLLMYRSVAWSNVGEKYAAARRPLLALLRRRYGKRSKGLRKDIRTAFASSSLQKGLQQVDSGDTVGAVRNFMRSLRYQPLFPLESGILGRVFQPRNMQRLKHFIRMSKQ